MQQFRAGCVGLPTCIFCRELQLEGLWPPITNRLFFTGALSIKPIRGAKNGTRVMKPGVTIALVTFREIVAKNA